MKWKRIVKRSGLVVLVLLFVWFQFGYWTSTNDCWRSVPPRGERMEAIKFCEYGSPDVLKVEEIEKPVPKDNEVLVRVRAASLNFIDAGLVRGPLVLRGLLIPATVISAGALTAADYVLATGLVRSVGSPCRVDQTADALRYFEEGHARGKFTGFGRDFAGVIEATGNDVTEFRPGLTREVNH